MFLTSPLFRIVYFLQCLNSPRRSVAALAFKNKTFWWKTDVKSLKPSTEYHNRVIPGHVMYTPLNVKKARGHTNQLFSVYPSLWQSVPHSFLSISSPVFHCRHMHLKVSLASLTGNGHFTKCEKVQSSALSCFAYMLMVLKMEP